MKWFRAETFDPDFAAALVRVSPNRNARRDGTAERTHPPDMILLHYTGMASGKAALDWLCARESEVSSHYFVDEGGIVTQLVPESERAWHAGQSFWNGETDINSASIGIEIVNPGHEGGCPPFPIMQMRAVARLCRDIIARHEIAAARVLAHSDVAPGRKSDPGEWFDWKYLADEGVGLWVEPEPLGGGRFLQEGDSGMPVDALQTMLRLYGYKVDADATFGTATREAVIAFQRHFRPARVDGIADASTITTLHRLLAALPRFS
ncbi:N-acetylmuramoyl-L-alanine amidase [Pseudohoeflea coraliihabitans]|uniref:N-acetylmuramoyl-L-alanine amidase n=1 Tax=Pseudohoeflea coraliihabitans TaxID=2860393 RepID=A0ABS6WJ13_9HYPH|nr:N-acetylmuramoyl-L-alanine amidase [Pseudohoeflea sp. DP4N28-3]MBW3095932.1 N-acetylmuramoyl-L-alanine amidase [Pseudohoeflea sp. DP4N28-3]